MLSGWYTLFFSVSHRTVGVATLWRNVSENVPVELLEWGPMGQYDHFDESIVVLGFAHRNIGRFSRAGIYSQSCSG